MSSGQGIPVNAPGSMQQSMPNVMQGQGKAAPGAMTTDPYGYNAAAYNMSGVGNNPGTYPMNQPSSQFQMPTPPQFQGPQMSMPNMQMPSVQSPMKPNLGMPNMRSRFKNRSY